MNAIRVGVLLVTKCQKNPFSGIWICSISEILVLSILLARCSKKGLGFQDGNAIAFLIVSNSLIL